MKGLETARLPAYNINRFTVNEFIERRDTRAQSASDFKGADSAHGAGNADGGGLRKHPHHDGGGASGLLDAADFVAVRRHGGFPRGAGGGGGGVRDRARAADPLAAFYGIGTGYIDLAYDCPRLLRFITQTPDGRAHGGEFLSIFNLESIRKNAGAIAAELEIPVEAARTWMEDCIICAHGIVTLLIAGLMTAARGEAKEKLFRMGCGALIAAGADKARTRAILEPLRGGNV